jgi:carbonic anhydrase
MKRILKFRSSRKHYHADAGVVWCMDKRFRRLLAAFLRSEELKNPDEVKIAGGIKGAASPNGDAEKRVLLRQIAASVKLHGTRQFIIMTHQDCGGYGGSAVFGNDPAKERQFHEQQLKRAKRTIKRKFPNLLVRAVYADFDGLSEVGV